MLTNHKLGIDIGKNISLCSSKQISKLSVIKWKLIKGCGESIFSPDNRNFLLDVYFIWKLNELFYLLLACSSVFALGMEKEDVGNGVQKIPNGNIQASSSSYSNPYDARLNGMKFWRPSVQSGAYLQVCINFTWCSWILYWMNFLVHLLQCYFRK